ncbi:MAG TPA: protein-methionine-sulfoxide reductase heme-binding subunit MsrQ [Chloroflexota bacterium]|nr:protein-methionine-sulfoxide reductase heme-binding subunit MsrQ [Chloroflexota bacterium]
MARTGQQSAAQRLPGLGRSGPRRREPWPWLKPGIFLGGLVPLVWLGLRASTGALSANPIAEAENELGLTALVFLLAALACSPARRLLGWTWPMRIRRELGLFAFFYAALHGLTYLVLDEFFDWGAIVADVAQRPFITVGVLALLLMVPLAVTSTNDWVRRLGYRRWQRIHQAVYLAGALAAIHFIWRVKLDVSQPLTYAAIFASLIALRLVLCLRQRYAGRAAGQG